MEIKVSIKKITIILSGIASGLAVLNVFLWILSVYGRIGNVYGFLSFFDLDSEMNIPTFFIFLLLLFCSFLLFLAGFTKNKGKKSFRIYWIFIGLVLFYIAIDELIQIHERLGPLFKMPSYMDKYLYFPWVIHEMIFVLVVFLLILRWLVRLPKNTRNRFLLAGAVYVLGAMVFEIIGGYYSSLPSFTLFVFKMISTAEEFLEMLGLIIFIRALLLYIKEVSIDGNVVFRLK